MLTATVIFKCRPRSGQQSFLGILSNPSQAWVFGIPAVEPKCKALRRSPNRLESQFALCSDQKIRDRRVDG